MRNIFINPDLGKKMYSCISDLFPICRSITGNGVRETLAYIADIVPDLIIHEVPTGTKAFDWNVPKEWNIKDAYVMDETGRKIIDFKRNNLHLMSYSIPINRTISLSELQEHLYSIEDKPEAIPYVTSYYEDRWGFCIAHKDREKLKDTNYKVFIDSELKNGSLTYGELIIQGKSKKEIFLSTYICHPSMANNELSGPIVTTFLAKWLSERDNKYTYRIIFIPETIGSITYLSRNLPEMQKNIIAGFNITCVGDERAYSYLPSRNGDTLADKAALHALKHMHPDFIKYSYLDRGSDERQYCSPGIDLPVCSIMRTKYGIYPEYHTSLDDLNLITANGLFESFKVLKRVIEIIEHNEILKPTVLCEPQMSKYGLYPTVDAGKKRLQIRTMMNILSYSDGKNSLLDIAEITNIPLWETLEITQKLKKAGLLKIKQ